MYHSIIGKKQKIGCNSLFEAFCVKRACFLVKGGPKRARHWQGLMQLFLSLPGHPSSRSDSRGRLCGPVTEEERVTHPLYTPRTFECIAPTTEPRVTRYRFRVKGATGNYILIHLPGLSPRVSKVRTWNSCRYFHGNGDEFGNLRGLGFCQNFSSLNASCYWSSKKYWEFLKIGLLKWNE